MLKRQRLGADLALELRKMIAADFTPGSRLPSEKELADQFGVSRNTVREALLSLWDEGLVVRKWGVGTFVRDADQPLTQSMSSVVPVHDLLRTAGQDVTLAGVTVELVACPDDAAAALTIEPGTTVWALDRTFAFDGRPAFVLQDWVPQVINGRAIDPTPVTDVEIGLLDVLRDTAKCRVTRMEAKFNAIAAGELAGRFGVSETFPLIGAEQVSIDSAGEIVIFARNYYNTDVSSLHLVRSTRIS